MKKYIFCIIFLIGCNNDESKCKSLENLKQTSPVILGNTEFCIDAINDLPDIGKANKISSCVYEYSSSGKDNNNDIYSCMVYCDTKENFCDMTCVWPEYDEICIVETQLK